MAIISGIVMFAMTVPPILPTVRAYVFMGKMVGMSKFSAALGNLMNLSDYQLTKRVEKVGDSS